MKTMQIRICTAWTLGLLLLAGCGFSESSAELPKLPSSGKAVSDSRPVKKHADQKDVKKQSGKKQNKNKDAIAANDWADLDPSSDEPEFIAINAGQSDDWEQVTARLTGDPREFMEAQLEQDPDVDPEALAIHLQTLMNDAIAGDNDAQYALGLLFQRSGGDEGDQLAYAWFAIAASNGNQSAASALEEFTDTLSDDTLLLAQEMQADLIPHITPEADVAQLEARNAERKQDLLILLSALRSYKADHNAYPETVPTGHSREVCRQHAANCSGRINLQILVDQNYLPQIPEDPQVGTDDMGTQYLVLAKADGSVSVVALGAEDQHLPMMYTSE